MNYKKYVYKQYDTIFPDLYVKEKARIVVRGLNFLCIEHVGSTAIPRLGGKGIIDIAIAVDQKEISAISQQIQALGYIFRMSGSTSDRLFFRIDLPDPIEGSRRYHLHLTYPESADWKGMIAFRDYLRSHPDELEEYAKLKSDAALMVNEDGEKYRKLKEPFFKAVLAKTVES